MLRFYKDLIGFKVADISTGRQIAEVTDIVINPHNLSVAAFQCYVRSKGQDMFLLTSEIHEVQLNMFTVQNEDALSADDDLVRIQEFLDINYKINGKKVRTESGKRVGVVTDFVVDDKSFMVSKLYARPPVTKVIQNSDRIIGRHQVSEVSDKTITVKDSTIRASQLSRAGADA